MGGFEWMACDTLSPVLLFGGNIHLVIELAIAGINEHYFQTSSWLSSIEYMVCDASIVH